MDVKKYLEIAAVTLATMAVVYHVAAIRNVITGS